MPFFSPGIVDDTPPVELTTRNPDDRLFRGFGQPWRGRNVFKKTGGIYTENSLDDETVIFIFRGPNVYEISESEALALTAAGWGAFIDWTILNGYAAGYEGGY